MDFFLLVGTGGGRPERERLSVWFDTNDDGDPHKMIETKDDKGRKAKLMISGRCLLPRHVYKEAKAIWLEVRRS